MCDCDSALLGSQCNSRRITESMHRAVVSAVFLTTNVYLVTSFQIPSLRALILASPHSRLTHFFQVYGIHPLDFEMPGHLQQ